MLSDFTREMLRGIIDELAAIEPRVPATLRGHMQQAIDHIAIVEFFTRPEPGPATEEDES